MKICFVAYDGVNHQLCQPIDVDKLENCGDRLLIHLYKDGFGNSLPAFCSMFDNKAQKLCSVINVWGISAGIINVHVYNDKLYYVDRYELLIDKIRIGGFGKRQKPSGIGAYVGRLDGDAVLWFHYKSRVRKCMTECVGGQNRSFSV